MFPRFLNSLIGADETIMHVLYEESGAFKVGTILADNDSSLQVEALHGKRSKVKSSAVLMRFADPAPGELLRQAEQTASEVDIQFLWECCGEPEFGFEALARDYCGHAPSPAEAAGILFKLQGAPVYFHRRGRGRFKAAPPEILKAALAALEKKRLQQEAIDRWAEELAAGRCPDPFKPLMNELLYRPDRNRPEYKALEKACETARLSAVKLFERAGVLPSSHDYHLNRFLFEFFPKGTGFPPGLATQAPAGMTLADVAAFSIDDETTTEIDDAFSLTPLGEGRVRVGIHIAAPGLGIAPGSPLGEVARERLSTVYMPGAKITMLPAEAVNQFTLAEGRACPAVSLYLDVREDGFVIEREHTVLERVQVAANLRHGQTAALDAAFATGTCPEDVPYAKPLHWLWRFALALEAGRGKPSAGDRADYNFEVIRRPDGTERIEITERPRGTPIDKLVAEMMIHANSRWGKLLDDNGLAAIYRVQTSGKVRMTASPGEHQGLGVSHYAWMTSPLRRYVDLLNQWQLLALLAGEAAPFQRNQDDLLAAVSDFDATYSQYADFQWRMERYWCLRWLEQEGVRVARAQSLRENLFRLKDVPLVVRAVAPADLAPGTEVDLRIGDIDFLEAELHCEVVPLPAV
jgi:exoribonuclease II